MGAVTIAGAGFLLAVLWFDLMFDVQVRGHDDNVLPDDVLASIASYYRRVTTDAHPMGRLVAVAMLATLGGLAGQLGSDRPLAPVVVCVFLAVPPIVLAGVRVFPAAARLATRADAVETQSSLARAIYRDHRFCFASIALLLATQITIAV